MNRWNVLHRDCGVGHTLMYICQNPLVVPWQQLNFTVCKQYVGKLSFFPINFWETCLVVQWLRLCASTEGKQSLIGELRSHMPLGKTKK